MNRYYVSPCDEGDGRQTWDVIRRELRNGKVVKQGTEACVSNHDKRQQARKACWQLNLNEALAAKVVEQCPTVKP